MLRHFYRLMVVALGLFLASSCGKSEPLYGIEATDFDDGTADEVVEEPDGDDHGITPTESDVMYGCPATDYRVEGNIVSAAGTPIRKIRITPESAWASLHGIDESTPGTSDTAGAFTVTAKDLCGSSANKITLAVEDVDGAANGQFIGKQVEVSLNCVDAGWWKQSCTNTEVKIELEEATSDDDTLPSDEDGSVDEDAIDDIPDMDDDEYADETVYGCVGCKFDVQGTVADAQGIPLKDIEVVVEQLDNPYAKTTAKTNAEGVFTVALNSDYGCNINEDSPVKVTFNDTDGAANGGDFESKEANLNLPWKGYEWDPCTYEKNNLEVKLDKVGNDDDTLLKD